MVKHSNTCPQSSVKLLLFHPVCLHQGELQQEELFVAVEILSAVALINQALEAGHLQQFGSLLVSLSAGLSDVDPTLLDRYDSSYLSDSHHVDSRLSLVVFSLVHFDNKNLKSSLMVLVP